MSVGVAPYHGHCAEQAVANATAEARRIPLFAE